MARSRSSSSERDNSRPLGGTSYAFQGGRPGTADYSQHGTQYGSEYYGGAVSKTVSSGRVTGAERVVGMSTRVDEHRQSILSERVVEHSIKVPKKIIHEEIVEKIVVIPEKIMREEMIEEVQVIREKIIEVAKPIIQERFVEVPQIKYVEVVREIPQIVYQERIKEVPRVEIQERRIEIPKIIHQDKVVEVPEFEYREVPYDKIVEVPEIREQIVLKEVPVPQYIDKPIAENVTVEVPVDVQRNIPVAVEAVSTFEYRLPQLKSRVNKVQYPIYVPRFIEYPVAQELFDAGLLTELQQNGAQVALLGQTSQAVSLCEVENLATMVRRVDVQNIVNSADFSSVLTEAWTSGKLNMTQTGMHTTYEGFTGPVTVSRGVSHHRSRRHHSNRKTSRK